MPQTRRDFLKTLGLAAAAVSFGAALPAEAGGPVPDAAALDEVLRVGDVFTIAGRYAVNPITRKTTDVLQQFIVTSVDVDRATLGFHPRLKTDHGESWPEIQAREKVRTRFTPPPHVTRQRR